MDYYHIDNFESWGEISSDNKGNLVKKCKCEIYFQKKLIGNISGLFKIEPNLGKSEGYIFKINKKSNNKLELKFTERQLSTITFNYRQYVANHTDVILLYEDDNGKRHPIKPKEKFKIAGTENKNVFIKSYYGEKSDFKPVETHKIIPKPRNIKKIQPVATNPSNHNFNSNPRPKVNTYTQVGYNSRNLPNQTTIAPKKKGCGCGGRKNS